MMAAEAKRLKELEDENRRLKQLVADLRLDDQILEHVASGNWKAHRGSARRSMHCKRSSRSPKEGRVLP